MDEVGCFSNLCMKESDDISKLSKVIELVVEPTHLKDMRKSNCIIPPRFGVKIKII